MTTRREEVKSAEMLQLEKRTEKFLGFFVYKKLPQIFNKAHT